MMKMETKLALEENLKRLGNKKFNKSDVKGISWQTFRRYVDVELLEWEELTEVSLEKVVALLNSCAGDDCWGCDWEFRAIDGKVYEVDKLSAYRIIKLKF